MLKKLLFLMLFGMFSALSHAQSVQVVSTNPANGAVDVDQDSIEIVFDTPIVFDTQNPENNVFDLFLSPEDSVDVTGFALRDGGTRLVINVTLTDNTDFLGVLTDVQGTGDETLAGPFIFQFTTSATAGQFVIEGQLTGEEMDNLKAQQESEGIIAFLTEDPFQIELDFDDEEEGEEPLSSNIEDEDDGPPIIPLYAAVVDPVTGEYTISGIREGSYFATGLGIAIDDAGDSFFPEIYIYDPDMNFNANILDIDGSTTTNDTVSNVDLSLVSFAPFTLQDAIARANSTISGLENNPDLLAGISEFEFFNFDFDMQGGIQIQATGITQNEDPEPPLSLLADGRNIIWQLFLYDSVRDSALPLIVTPVGTLAGDFIGQADAEIPVAFSTLDPIPATFIDSDSAMNITNASGGMAFLDMPGDADVRGVTIEAFHSYFQFPPNPTEDAPVMYRIEYERDSFGFGGESTREDSLVFYLDIVTGDVLFTAGNLLEEGPDFNITGSTPTDGTSSVATTADITFTFDSPVRFDVEAEDTEDFGFIANVFPNDGLEVNSFTLNELGTELVVNVTQDADTDFTWIIQRARSTSGGNLAAPFILNYTTAASSGAQTISGTLSEAAQAKIQAGLPGSAVLLFDQNPFEDSDDGEGEGDGGPDLSVASATLVDGDDGTYTLSGVRDGEYLPFAINLLDNTLGDEVMEIGIYDPNDDGIPDPVTVSGGNLTGIDLQFVELVGITARDGLQIALDSAAALDATLDLYFVASDEITLLDTFEFDDDDDMPPPPVVANATDEEVDDPTALAESWEYVFYSPTNQFAYAIEVGQFGIIEADTLDSEDIEEDIEFEDGMGFADIDPLPAMFIDSDSALTVAQTNGGMDFLNQDVPANFIELEFILSNATFFIPEELNVAEGTNFWEVIYLRAFVDPITNNFSEEEFIVYVNAVDGSLLGSTLFETEPFTAIQGVDAATEFATGIAADNELVFINGFSILDRDPDLDMPPPPALSKQLNTDLPGADALNGEFFAIDYRFYSEINDDQTAVFVNSFGEANTFPNASLFFLPQDGTVGLGDLEPIDTDIIIDSDSALAIAEMEGGEEFRNRPHFGLDLVRLDISAQAGNFFFAFPDGSGLSDTTIAWQIFYNRETINQGTGVREFENATFLINAFTGELINEQLQVSNEDEDEIPNEVELLQNFPNPFNPTTVIPFRINQAQNVEVAIFNILGQRVATLSNQLFQAGSHNLTWDASQFSSGIYIYQLRTADVVQTRKLTLIK